MNLAALHEAITTARCDRDECLKKLEQLLRSASTEARQLLAKLDGDIHELDLLQRREVELISNGKETGAEA